MEAPLIFTRATDSLDRVNQFSITALGYV